MGRAPRCGVGYPLIARSSHPGDSIDVEFMHTLTTGSRIPAALAPVPGLGLFFAGQTGRADEFFV